MRPFPFRSMNRHTEEARPVLSSPKCVLYSELIKGAWKTIPTHFVSVPYSTHSISALFRYMDDYAEEAAPAPTKHSYLSGPSTFNFELANSDSETEDYGGRR